MMDSMDTDDRIVREAETFLRSLTRSDLNYRDAFTVWGGIDDGEWVAVATFGSADDLTGSNDEPEPWPIRLRVHSSDDAEAEAYLSIDEANGVINALRRAIYRANSYPKP
jgi:hypothetical protein